MRWAEHVKRIGERRGGEYCIYDFCGKTRRKETTRKSKIRFGRIIL
jgi:hypothetical protein